MPHETCLYCDKPKHAQDLCNAHYGRLVRYGDPTVVKRKTFASIEERFWSKVNKNTATGCWEWTGATDNGYGRIKIYDELEYAHVYSYKLVHPKYMTRRYVTTLDHKCRNRKCVNPDHLKVETHIDNVMLGEGWGAVNARKTHCNKGHEYTAQNTRIEASGSRRCRTCLKMRVR